ncbi:hypothetical protein [Streptomyces sp. ISL-94]|uniref:hypothetical protein n=1 Tax=Streptomyces sp. ISL-94 TaxID=2819190 RepID=UPI001BEB82B7|nr:hypothetical protein [Streptomyces sp. ISL-94]MBT2477667.1 hypothetical protein [Streptomyces sp. ISL-94]
MDATDLDWAFTQGWPGDPTLNGFVPQVGEHVFCYRPSDGATRCGTVDDNRAGLFLATCASGRVALTAARWAVTATPAAACA